MRSTIFAQRCQKTCGHCPPSEKILEATKNIFTTTKTTSRTTSTATTRTTTTGTTTTFTATTITTTTSTTNTSTTTTFTTTTSTTTTSTATTTKTELEIPEFQDDCVDKLPTCVNDAGHCTSANDLYRKLCARTCGVCGQMSALLIVNSDEFGRKGAKLFTIDSHGRSNCMGSFFWYTEKI